MKPGDEERSLTTGACWHSAYSSEVSPLQQKKDLLQDREREKKTNTVLNLILMLVSVHFRHTGIVWKPWENETVSKEWHSGYPQTPQFSSDTWTVGASCSTGELCLHAPLITFTICYSYMQKQYFCTTPPYLRVALALVLVAEVCMCLISFELHC